MNQGYAVKKRAGVTKRYCQTMNLKENPILIEQYRKIHSREEAWPEIRQGIREVGIQEMEIYIHGFKLFMIVETCADFHWEEAMERLSHLPRQAEWEEHVARFQECIPGSTSAEKWQMMERIFHLYD